MTRFSLLYLFLTISVQFTFIVSINDDNKPCLPIFIPRKSYSSKYDRHIQVLQSTSTDDVKENCLNVTLENTILNHKEILFMKFEINANQSDSVDTKLLYSINNSNHMFQNQTEVRPSRKTTFQCKVLFDMSFKVI